MIRFAIRDDLDAVYGLMRQLSSRDFTMEQFKNCYFFNIEKRQILVYEKDHTLRGCLVYSINYYLHYSRKSAEIVNLVVDESVRGNGIGKELLTVFERIAIEMGCVCFEVASGNHREAAHRFYSREGFVCDHLKFVKEIHPHTVQYLRCNKDS